MILGDKVARGLARLLALARLARPLSVGGTRLAGDVAVGLAHVEGEGRLRRGNEAQVGGYVKVKPARERRQDGAAELACVARGHVGCRRGGKGCQDGPGLGREGVARAERPRGVHDVAGALRQNDAYVPREGDVVAAKGSLAHRAGERGVSVADLDVVAGHVEPRGGGVLHLGVTSLEGVEDADRVGIGEGKDAARPHGGDGAHGAARRKGAPLLDDVRDDLRKAPGAFVEGLRHVGKREAPAVGDLGALPAGLGEGGHALHGVAGPASADVQLEREALRAAPRPQAERGDEAGGLPGAGRLGARLRGLA